jgi:hypothetical protein
MEIAHLRVVWRLLTQAISYDNGRRQIELNKLYLLDVRFAEQRRKAQFNRETDDWGKVDGIMTLTVTQ